MRIIQSPNNTALQKQSIALDDGTFFSLEIYYVPLQFGWFIQELVYGDFVIKGMRITDSPNMLRQYQNQIPFGIGCTTKGNREPTQQEDFSSGASTLYLLTQEECRQYQRYLSGQV